MRFRTAQAPRKPELRETGVDERLCDRLRQVRADSQGRPVLRDEGPKRRDGREKRRVRISGSRGRADRWGDTVHSQTS